LINRKLLKKIGNSKKSVLLIGPRQTGKSTLMKSLSPDLSINLINETEYLNFSANPAELEQRLKSKPSRLVLIDEVQRIPSILNTIQSILDDWPNPPKFLITGSSARKLRKGHANLLPGRVFTYSFGPLASSELNYDLSEDVISYGSLPGVYTETDLDSRKKLLESYAGTYLKEEIQAEALTKNLEGFARFLYVAAGEATRFLDLAKLASQARIERHSAVRWFEILEDTLLVHRVQSFAKSTRTRIVQHPRFFFFDNGILNALLRNFGASVDRNGFLFENLFHSQLMASAYAADVDIQVSSFRTEHGAEIDFIVELAGQTWAIECKSSTHIEAVNSKPFKSFQAIKGKNFISAVAYRGPIEKVIDGVIVAPWQVLLKKMGL
jgi:predicted AAA+ superfamily ATPase